ncbi:MAG: branched-chain amino acid aminotransferase [Dehalococcoidia bacterium]|nr:branched-chain amino acid aminotransferase [Dehalococcoidia bacterium]MQG15386.1 branched-chain amino acid aminotransferase [SAR202 cluster bacterium]|tara:strand:+ start:128215 stop:129120 length:906 start_codon:yes stop_codon:yes gene_type:complete
MNNKRVAYVNGEIVPEIEAKVSYNDVGFLYGDAVFDTTRTFGGKIFRLEQHLDRFFQSLKYMRIDPLMTQDEMSEITMEVLERNLPLLGDNEDYWVSQRVSRGVRQDLGGLSAPTVVIETFPLPLKQRAPLYKDGLQLVTPSVRRTPPVSQSPRAKVHNYINIVQADLEVKSQNPNASALMLDINGNLCEGMGANLFLVKDGEVFTPHEQYILAGISRQVTIDLANELGINVKEKNLDLYDAYTADEIFVTSTSYCICPVASVNGSKPENPDVPGPLTKRLMDAYSGMVGIDIVGQYIAHL